MRSDFVWKNLTRVLFIRWYVAGASWSFKRLYDGFEPHFIVVSKTPMPGILINLRAEHGDAEGVRKAFLSSTTSGVDPSNDVN